VIEMVPCVKVKPCTAGASTCSLACMLLTLCSLKIRMSAFPTVEPFLRGRPTVMFPHAVRYMLLLLCCSAD